MLVLFSATKMGGRRLAATLIAVLLALGAPSPSSAGSFRINPVNVELPAGRSSASVSIKNNNNEPVAIRVIGMKWTQVNGQDVHAQTQDVIASPPIFTIKGGATQLVRLGLRARAPGAAYRLIFEEIPNGKPEGSAIQVALRVDLPFYVLHDKGQANLSWKAFRNRAGELMLEAHNQGDRHAQIVELNAFDAAGMKITLSRRMGVVLPGSRKQWNAGRQDFALSASLPISVRSQGAETKTNALVEAR